MGEIDRSLKRTKVESPDISDDDIWASDGGEFHPNVDDGDFYGERTDRPENAEIAAVRRVHAKQGYLAGLSSAKEESLQQGFDEGYPSGAIIGLEVGKILGTLQLLSSFNGVAGTKAKELLSTAKTELHIKKVLHRRYFDDNVQLPEEGHTVVNKWKIEVEQLVKQQRLELSSSNEDVVMN
ncbi:CYFA0S04e00936g1_1 [Cyberlindnera fabianii]|uniref:Protein YAE1 n=1 Tax=Cyberlindnera fabianii TaxID=36022 RepID=A0A061AQQ2_CYBFA|nr:CYFA0S04e00936g1_1 [Cyberlindnera fabianii]